MRTRKAAVPKERAAADKEGFTVQPEMKGSPGMSTAE
jgi:hypothetical protein